jgi:hypothetical protein
VFDGGFNDLHHVRSMAIARVRGFERLRPDIFDRNPQGTLYPFLIGRALYIPA